MNFKNLLIIIPKKMKLLNRRNNDKNNNINLFCLFIDFFFLYKNNTLLKLIKIIEVYSNY